MKIEIDDDLYEYLQANARAFEDTPSTVLRRLLGLDRAGEAPRTRHSRAQNPGVGLEDPKRYLPGRVVTITGPRVRRPVESGVRTERGADLNQVATDIARLVGHRNPETSRALENLRNGSRREQVGDVVLTVTDRAPERKRLWGTVPSLGDGPTLEEFSDLRREMWQACGEDE